MEYERPSIDYTKEVKRYHARQANGAGIITILADNVDNARALIRYELDKNWSRRGYLARWQADGEIVTEED